jgi:hypothetical protein
MHADTSDFRQRQETVVESRAVAILLERKGVKAIAALEAPEARLLAALDAAEERLVRLI